MYNETVGGEMSLGHCPQDSGFGSAEFKSFLMQTVVAMETVGVLGSSLVIANV